MSAEPPTRPLFKTINIVKVCLMGPLHSRRAGKKGQAEARMLSLPGVGSGRHCCIPLSPRSQTSSVQNGAQASAISTFPALFLSHEAKHRRAPTHKCTRRHRPTRPRTLLQKHISEFALARAAALSTSPAHHGRPEPRGSPPPSNSFTLRAQAEIPRRPQQ